jgi:hypothetical protein
VCGIGRRDQGATVRTGHAFREFFKSFIAEVGMETETGVSLGPKSARLRSRHGDIHFLGNSMPRTQW